MRQDVDIGFCHYFRHWGLFRQQSSVDIQDILEFNSFHYPTNVGGAERRTRLLCSSWSTLLWARWTDGGHHSGAPWCEANWGTSYKRRAEGKSQYYRVTARRQQEGRLLKRSSEQLTDVSHVSTITASRNWSSFQYLMAMWPSLWDSEKLLSLCSFINQINSFEWIMGLESRSVTFHSSCRTSAVCLLWSTEHHWVTSLRVTMLIVKSFDLNVFNLWAPKILCVFFPLQFKLFLPILLQPPISHFSKLAQQIKVQFLHHSDHFCSLPRFSIPLWLPSSSALSSNHIYLAKHIDFQAKPHCHWSYSTSIHISNLFSLHAIFVNVSASQLTAFRIVKCWFRRGKQRWGAWRNEVLITLQSATGPRLAELCLIQSLHFSFTSYRRPLSSFPHSNKGKKGLEKNVFLR